VVTGKSPEKRREHGPRGASPVSGKDEPVPLDCSFYERPAAVVARDLLGTIIISTVGKRRCTARIVETEAYTGPEDDASHAAARIGRTQRNDVMFGLAGRAYVYRIYGVHWCLNTVTDQEGHPSAVLVRAAEPLEGIDVARHRRPGRPDRDLMRGPGNLCAALGITNQLNGHMLDRPPLLIAPGSPLPDDAVATGPRVGITRAADLPLRFWETGSHWVSGRTKA
jgi:DNA-3-methyladenine glycosylase